MLRQCECVNFGERVQYHHTLERVFLFFVLSTKCSLRSMLWQKSIILLSSGPYIAPHLECHCVYDIGEATAKHEYGYCESNKCLATYIATLPVCRIKENITNSCFCIKHIYEQSDIKTYPEYDSFERQGSEYFNSAYFKGTCSANPANSWFIQWVDAYCPAQINQISCTLSFVDKYACDTTCEVSPWSLEYCCPSEVDCKGGLLQACPYEQCRLEALSTVVVVLK